MEHPERYLNNSFFYLLFIMIFGCNPSSKEPESFEGPLVDISDDRISNRNGLLFFELRPFTGVLYELFPGTTDTASKSAYVNAKEDGLWIKYYANSEVKEKRFFKNGLKTGELTSWWPNGQIQFSYFFVKDEYEGSCREWNEKGVLVKDMHYHKGHEEGYQKSWYDNGKIRANYFILDGRRFGLLGTKNCINVTDSIFQE